MIAARTPRVYCTYFDSGYLSRGLTLISSLRRFGDNSDVYVLALDSATETFLRDHAPENVFVINIDKLENAEPDLLPLKTKRSRMEYYFTCTPLLIRYVMNQLATPHSIAIYLDADLFFFDDPQVVVEAMEGASVGIIEHRYPDSAAKKLEKYGRFNVGWLGFRDDEEGRTVLDWYSKSTLEWCSDKPESGKYADQGYLNWFPHFAGVRILTSASFNLAPWNTRRHNLTLDDKVSNSVLVDGTPLNFFHFHGLREFHSWFTSSQLLYSAPMTKVLRENVYRPYVKDLASTDVLVRKLNPAQPRISKRGSGIIGFLSRQRSTLIHVVSILTGNALKNRFKSSSKH